MNKQDEQILTSAIKELDALKKQIHSLSDVRIIDFSKDELRILSQCLDVYYREQSIISALKNRIDILILQ